MSIRDSYDGITQRDSDLPNTLFWILGGSRADESSYFCLQKFIQFGNESLPLCELLTVDTILLQETRTMYPATRFMDDSWIITSTGLLVKSVIILILL